MIKRRIDDRTINYFVEHVNRDGVLSEALTQTVELDYTPSPDADTFTEYATVRTNPGLDGRCMDTLVDLIENFPAALPGIDTQVDKSILYVRRYECPCCATHVEALVEVSCQGSITAEVPALEGLYRYTLDRPDKSYIGVVERVANRRPVESNGGTNVVAIMPIPDLVRPYKRLNQKEVE